MTSPDLLSASSDRPLAVRMRPDLEVQVQTYQGRGFRIVKDPLSLTYFRFEEPEFAVLEMLDGRTSPQQIRERFERRFAPLRLSLRELNQLLGMLHRSGLLVADAASQGQQLAQRASQRRRQLRFAQLANILAIRFRGVDPDRLLVRLNRWAGWIFSWPAALAAAVLGAAALLLLAAEFDVFCSRLPAFGEFFAMQNWLALAVTLAVTKILHELGHGLACKRFGGECHEMGLMLLVFTPCLYCNVTDTWMVPSKWKRAAVAAAGMYVELILASLATLGWWYSQRGLVNGLCLDVMFVCSAGTLLFNANPLMRYDGYYILADLVEIPNLRQKASQIIQRKLAAWILGLPEPEDPFLPSRRRWLLAVYGVASTTYGWLVTLSILWFLYQVLEPYGLQVIGQLLALAVVAAMLVAPLWRVAKYFHVPGRIDRVKKGRALAACSMVGAAAAALLLVPLPYYVPCSFHVQPRGGTTVYVEVPGEVKQVFVSSGPVAAGQPILELENIDAALAEQALAGERAQLLARMEALRQQAHTDDEAHLELAAARETLEAIDAQLAARRERMARLVVRAPATGLLLPAGSRPAPAAAERGTTLASWSGRPLSRQNVGARLESSTVVGQIVQPNRLEAILAVAQEEVEFVQAGQRVDLFPTSLPGQRLTERIERVSQQEMQHAPAGLSHKAGGRLATRTDGQGIERPVEVTYLADVPLEDHSGCLLPGTTGQAKVHAGYQSLAARLWRGLCQTFRFPKASLKLAWLWRRPSMPRPDGGGPGLAYAQPHPPQQSACKLRSFQSIALARLTLVAAGKYRHPPPKSSRRSLPAAARVRPATKARH